MFSSSFLHSLSLSLSLSGIGFLVAVLSFIGHGFSVTVPILIFGWFWSVELLSILSFGGGADLDSLLVLGVTLSHLAVGLFLVVVSGLEFRLVFLSIGLKLVSVACGCSFS